MAKVPAPRKGDGVYDERRIEKQLQPNGMIKRIRGDEVQVVFHDQKWNKDTNVTMSLGDFTIRGKNNQWMFWVS